MSSESSPPLADESPTGHSSGRSPVPETEPIPQPARTGGGGGDASTLELSEIPDLIRAVWQARTVHAALGDAHRETETAHGHTPQPTLRPGTRLEGGLLCILEPIDAGGMGEVYLAWHELLNAEVAVKVAQAPEMEVRFNHEIELQNCLGGHPNIVAVKTAGRFGDCSYLMMEYVPGLDLRRYIAERGPLPWREACGCIRQVALGLAHAHAKGVVHRDLKPSNLIRSEADGLVKILDWGLARRWDNASPDEDKRLTQPGVIVGTPDYMAPERIGDPEQVGPSSDLYSLGCTLYELLTGYPPFHKHPNKLQAHLREPIPALPAELGVPPGVNRVLRRLLGKRVDERYGSAQELVEALDSTLVTTLSARLRRERWNLSHAALALGTIAVVAAISVAASYWSGQGLTGLLVSTGRLKSGGAIQNAPAALTLSSFAVRHYRPHTNKPSDDLGLIGHSNEAVRVGDDIRIGVELSEPAYAYLLALNTNGKVQLCLPEDDAQPPPRTQHLELYPSKEDYFTLTEGSGVQAFVVLASRLRLPAYRDWHLDVDALHWAHTEGTGVWRYDGKQFAPEFSSSLGWASGTRGTKTRRVSKPFDQACRYLRDRSRVEAIGAIAFPVLPSDVKSSGQ